MKPLKHLPYIILAAAILIAWQVSDFDVRCIIVVVTTLVLVALAVWHFIVKPYIDWHRFGVDETDKVRPMDCGDENCEICNPDKTNP